jgi:NAD(P)-dependent dehydrogenase (short-subunit alcohol dehydrogenase family)
MKTGVAPDFAVAGLTVLITGGSGGIGMAFARAFAAAGAAAVVADVKPPAETLPEGVSFARLDVRSDSEVAALATRLKRVDILIHCAGRLVRFEEYKIEVFKEIVDIHLFGAMRLAEAFRPRLKSSGRGSIILIGSMYSYFGAPMIPAYTAAKTAIVGLTRSLAVGYAAAGDDIRVNCIAPGWINTEISRRGREERAFNAKVMDRLPTRRWSEPAELAGTAVFLASPAAKLINGVTVPVDGGYAAS